jgi:hypothetical protein
MSKQRNSEAESTNTLHVWTYAEAVKALPYVRALVASLREHWLHLQRARLQVRRLDARPGRWDRQALIVRAEAVREAELVEGHFNEAQRELEALGVSGLDPAAGRALIPFRQGDELAWFIFDLFAPRGLETGQFQADSLETRRPLVEPLDPRLVDVVFSS